MCPRSSFTNFWFQNVESGVVHILRDTQVSHSYTVIWGGRDVFEVVTEILMCAIHMIKSVFVLFKIKKKDYSMFQNNWNGTSEAV